MKRSGPAAFSSLDPKTIPDPLQRQISHSIATRRVAQGMSQRELAEKSGVSRTTLQELDRGDHIPHLRQLARILDALGFELVAQRKPK